MSRLIRAFFGKDEQETRIREKNTITKLHPKTMAKGPSLAIPSPLSPPIASPLVPKSIIKDFRQVLCKKSA
jgi:hypothetical protein